MRETGIKKMEGNDKKILEKYEILLIENSYILLRCAECEYNIGEPALSPSPSISLHCLHI